MQSKNQTNTEGGQVMIIITMFMLGASMILTAGIMASVLSQVRVLNEQSFSKKSYAFAEGLLEDVVYRNIQGMDVDGAETLSEDGLGATTISSPTLDGVEITSVGNASNRTRKIRTVLVVGDGASFSFGVQAGNGGFVLENNSRVIGNVYSNAAVTGSNLNLITGTVIAGGPSGLVDNIHATGSVYAHSIQDSYIEEDAYYQSIDIGTVVDGTKYPGSTDIGTSSFPIPDSTIDSWETYASTSGSMEAQCIAGGGTITFDSDVSLGPVKIPCNVTFEKFPDVTINGVIWIQGDLDFKQGPKLSINPAIGNKSVPIVVSNPNNQLTSSRVTLENSGIFSGNGNRSYILIVGRNRSAEAGGAETAVRIKNSAGGSLLVYSNHGEIALENNTDLTMITAWRVKLQNFTEVRYDTGIASTLFETGPGGGYTIDSWREVE